MSGNVDARHASGKHEDDSWNAYHTPGGDQPGPLTVHPSHRALHRALQNNRRGRGQQRVAGMHCTL